MSSKQQFDVTVSVDPRTKALTCSPDPVTVTCADGQLRFELANSGYGFPKENAIVVTDGGTQFPLPCNWHSNQLVTLHDKASHKGSYKYTVTVVNLASGEKIVLDPGIDNDPDNPPPACPPRRKASSIA
ncbi:MAG: hypothetical protein HY021_07410 [Burkholderiales bacterium]|nr:hypothetical protein [Burkholderiales bacterium]